MQFDTGVQTGFELEQSFAWEYDDLGRLTVEAFDLGHDGEKVQPLFCPFSVSK
jgi:hypothetical protein